MTDDLQAHPADVLAQQLDRVSGLVRTLADLYAPKNESFAAGNSFIAHGLVAVSTLLDDAQGTLDQLHEVCDLQIKNTASHSPINSPVEDMEPMVFPPIEPVWQNVEAPIVAEQMEAQQMSMTPESPVHEEQFAQSYLELLRKLTAAEVFAAEQQALAPPGSGQNLLPLLRSLREEFQKLHKVA